MMLLRVNCGMSQAEVSAVESASSTLSAKLELLGYRPGTSADFDILAIVNQDRRDRDFPPLVPWYDPEVEPCGYPDAFWVGLSDRYDHDRLVGTIACRLRYVRGNLRERLQDMTFLFPDAAERKASGHVTSPDLGALSGSLMLPGAMWIDPDHRGKGLSKLLFALAMIQGYARWKPDHVIGLVEPKKELKVGFESYGFPRSHKRFVPNVPNFAFTANGEDLAVMSMSQWEMRARFVLGEDL